MLCKGFLNTFRIQDNNLTVVISYNIILHDKYIYFKKKSICNFFQIQIIIKASQFKVLFLPAFRKSAYAS